MPDSTFRREVEKKVDGRLIANLKLLSILNDYAKLNPGMRFHQILQNLKVDLPDVANNYATGQLHMVDLYYEESVDTYDRVVLSYAEAIKNHINNEETTDQSGPTGDTATVRGGTSEGPF